LFIFHFYIYDSHIKGYIGVTTDNTITILYMWKENEQ